MLGSTSKAGSRLGLDVAVENPSQVLVALALRQLLLMSHLQQDLLITLSRDTVEELAINPRMVEYTVSDSHASPVLLYAGPDLSEIQCSTDRPTSIRGRPLPLALHQPA